MTVKKKGDKWVIVHCRGGKQGKVIGEHSTRSKAYRQHRAIMASKKYRKNK